MKRVVIMLAVVMMLFCTLISCGKKPSSDAPDGSHEAGGETTRDSELGFEKEDNGDRNFSVLVNNKNAHFDMKSDFIGLETGNVVEYEVWRRTQACCEYLGIDIQYFQQDGSYNSNIINLLRPISMAGGEDAYQMVAIGLNTGIIGQTIDIFYNVLDMQSVNTEHAWWVQDVTEQVSMNGQLYFLTGDCAISTYGYLGCVFANLGVAANYGIETDFYEVVRGGTWTMEEFFRLWRDVGDGEVNYAVDPEHATLGWANVSTGVRAMWSACNVSLFDRDAETEAFSLKSALDDRTLTFIGNFKTAYERPNSYYFGDDKLTDADALFIGDRCLFYSYYLYKAKDFNEGGMKSDFAILPLPKCDNSQTDYISANVSAYNALFFLSSTLDPELSGKVAEYMGWYGKAHVIPAYYDDYLKLRSGNRVENIEMLDLIRDRLRVSPNELYGVIENVIGRTALTDANVLNLTTEAPFYSNPVSQWEKISRMANKKIIAYIMQYYGQ